MKIGLLTTGRHDLSYLTPIKEALGDHGAWIKLSDSQCVDDLAAACKATGAMGWAVTLMHREKIDRLVVLGDRTETLAACVGATCLKIPIAHIHGGEVTLGAIDNVCRHAISQLADVHFAATQDSADRLLSMQVPGEIVISGSPAIDLMLRKKRERRPGKDVVLAYHPETMSDEPPRSQMAKAMAIAEDHLLLGGKVICVGANPDAGGLLMNEMVSKAARFELRTGLTSDEYWDLLSTCRCLVGNSSSGVIEAPVLGVPFVEIGDRQKGRYRGSYGDGKATERIVGWLRAYS